ncbi:uncharacterized protein LOC135116987, partial [Helicoverpa armigera]|uniref:uncharacterized protein LOC135116987 n=1 Tax=Helicoverpa armigera TaxID=29058 RepID=UPI00308331E6
MDQNVVDCELAERDTGLCVCKGGPTLEILKDIQRLYEEKMEHIEKASGPTKLQMQVEVLRAWVGDLVGQNTLLARAVEELETEATTKLLVERRRNSERSSKNIVCGKVSELKLLNEALQKENIAKDREIRQLNKDAQTYEQTIMNLRKEMSSCKYHTPEVAKKDAEVMAGMCCTGRECGEWEPVKDFSELLRDETLKYQERVQKMESNLKSSGDSIRALRKVNVNLSEEMHSMRRVRSARRAVPRRQHARAVQGRDHSRDAAPAQAGQGEDRYSISNIPQLKDTTEITSLKSKDYVSGDGECPHASAVSYDSPLPVPAVPVRVSQELLAKETKECKRDRDSKKKAVLRCVRILSEIRQIQHVLNSCISMKELGTVVPLVL